MSVIGSKVYDPALNVLGFCVEIQEPQGRFSHAFGHSVVRLYWPLLQNQVVKLTSFSMSTSFGLVRSLWQPYSYELTIWVCLYMLMFGIPRNLWVLVACSLFRGLIVCCSCRERGLLHIIVILFM